jgi:uncharacterized small protein (DUF1192 family)
MDWDEVRPKAPASTVTLGQDLSALSIGELSHLIERLRGEIDRVEQELARKKKHEAAAAAIFKS